MHKLIDNLKLFHELAGPIFPPSIRPKAKTDGRQPEDGQADGPRYDEDGLPELPPRLRLRLPQQWRLPPESMN